ncbi:hypothetical protein GJQ54_08100 [Oceanospirillaceae bacterium ASx5O]|nr:hypothetical protein GJQ54_08100 [Oceanospirillaceae bacterium ASx5O]
MAGRNDLTKPGTATPTALRLRLHSVAAHAGGVSQRGFFMGIYDELMSTGHWSDTQVRLGIEFNFRCAYCDKDMFGSVDNHSEWQSDHIKPTSKGGADVIDNLALSCRTCNFIKGTWDPSEDLSQEEILKEYLIKRARTRISERRQKIQEDIELYKSILTKHC